MRGISPGIVVRGSTGPLASNHAARPSLGRNSRGLREDTYIEGRGDYEALGAEGAFRDSFSSFAVFSDRLA